MHLKKITDYSIRTLMYLACLPPEQLSNISTISGTFGISQNHLMKVVNRLAQLNYLETVRGKGGGVRLGRPAADIQIGTLIEQLESNETLIDCSDGPCKFIGKCHFADILQQGSQAFYREMNKHSLADLVQNKDELKEVVFFR